MRILTLIVVILSAALVGCNSRQVRTDDLAFLKAQLDARNAAEAAREEKLAQAQADCADKTDAGAIGVCFLGLTATTQASRPAGGAGAASPIVMPPAPPPSGWVTFGNFMLGISKLAAPAYLGKLQSDNATELGIRQSDNATALGIAQGEQLYGFLGRSAEASAATAGGALGSMERFGTVAISEVGDTTSNAVDAMAQTSADWANAAPLLAPDITVDGTGNAVGDGNTLTLDQSQQGRDRIAEGQDNQIQIDQSTVAGDRLHQEGEANRQLSPGPYDQDIVCELASAGATGGSGAAGTGTGATGGAGAAGGQATGTLTCTPGNG